MKKKKTQILLQELFFICFFVLMLVAKGIGLYDGQTLYKIFLIAALGCIAFKMCITEYTIKEWGVIIALGLLTGVVYFVSKEKGILLCAATIIGMKNVSVKKVFKVGAWTWGLSMLANIIYHLIFLYTSGYKVHEKLGLGHIFRWDLGFSHPNVLHIAYLTLTAFFVYNLGRKYDWKYFLLLMIGNIFVFIYSVSYTGIIVVTLYLGISLYMNIRKELCTIEYVLLELVFPTAVIFSLFSPIILPEKIFNILNKVFNTRLSLAKIFLVKENIKFFGNNLESITTYLTTMDNSYVFLFVVYGMVVFVLFVIGYLFTIHFYVKKQKNMELAMIISFAVAGITEPFMFNTSFKNLTLLFVGNYLWKVLEDNSDQRQQRKILHLKNQTFNISFISIFEIKKEFQEIWFQKKKYIILISCIVGLAAGAITGIFIQMPKGYVVPRKQVTMESKETWYLESKEDKRFDGSMILDYENTETKMQYFEGNIVKVEWVRKIISMTIMVAFISGMGYTVSEVMKVLRKNSKRNK